MHALRHANEKRPGACAGERDVRPRAETITSKIIDDRTSSSYFVFTIQSDGPRRRIFDHHEQGQGSENVNKQYLVDLLLDHYARMERPYGPCECETWLLSVRYKTCDEDHARSNLAIVFPHHQTSSESPVHAPMRAATRHSCDLAYSTHTF